MEKGLFCHPEVRHLVIKEYHRLRQRHADEIDGSVMWEMARDYVWTLQLADSAILRCELALGETI